MKHDMRLSDESGAAAWYFRALVIAAIALFPVYLYFTEAGAPVVEENARSAAAPAVLAAVTALWLAGWVGFTVLTAVKNDVKNARAAAIWWGLSLAAFALFMFLPEFKALPPSWVGISMFAAAVAAAPTLLSSSLPFMTGASSAVTFSLVIITANFLIILINRYRQRRLD